MIDDLTREMSAAVGQRTDDWFDQRLGMVTASGFQNVMARGRGKEEFGKMFDTYALGIAIEQVFRVPWKGEISTAELERGKAAEKPAIDRFEELTDLRVLDVGFLRLSDRQEFAEFGDVGGSPDGIVEHADGEQLTFELKARKHPVDHFYTIINGIKPENMAQVQGQMLLTGCMRAYYVTYCDMLPPEHQIHYQIVERDDEYLESFLDRMGAFRARVEAYVEQIKSK